MYDLEKIGKLVDIGRQQSVCQKGYWQVIKNTRKENRYTYQEAMNLERLFLVA